MKKRKNKAGQEGLWQTYKTTPLSKINQTNVKVRFPVGQTFDGIHVWPDVTISLIASAEQVHEMLKREMIAFAVKEPAPASPAPIAPAPKA
jgi:hypothetical protein